MIILQIVIDILFMIFINVCQMNFIYFWILDIMGNSQDKVKDNKKAIAVKTIDK